MAFQTVFIWKEFIFFESFSLTSSSPNCWGYTLLLFTPYPYPLWTNAHTFVSLYLYSFLLLRYICLCVFLFIRVINNYWNIKTRRLYIEICKKVIEKWRRWYFLIWFNYNHYSSLILSLFLFFSWIVKWIWYYNLGWVLSSV